MSNTIRSDSYSESVKRGFQPRTASSSIELQQLQQQQQQRSTTLKKTFRFPSIPEAHAITEYTTISESNVPFFWSIALSLCSILSVASPTGHRQRSPKTTRVHGLSKVQSAREVSLRVKFIRLGEVISPHPSLAFLHPCFLPKRSILWAKNSTPKW